MCRGFRFTHEFEGVALLQLGPRSGDLAMALEHVDSLVELGRLQVQLSEGSDGRIAFRVDRQRLQA